MTHNENSFIGCQLTQMNNAYIRVLTFNKVMDPRDFARFLDNLNEQIKGRKMVQYLEDNRKQLIVVIFHPKTDSAQLDNKIRQVISSCSPNVRVSY